MSIFTKIWAFIKKIGQWTVSHIAPTAVAIIEELQTLWKSGTPDFIAQVLGSLVKSGVPAEIVAAIGNKIPQSLALFMGIRDFPANPTQDQIAALEKQFLAFFGVMDDKSELYTTLGAQLIVIVKRDIESGKPYTFGTAASELEEAYQDWLADKAALDEGGDETATE